MNCSLLRRALLALLIGFLVTAIAALPVRAQAPATKPVPAKPAKEAPKPAKEAAKPPQDKEIADAVKRFETDSRDVFKKRTKIVDACRLKPGMDVADVGAGTGLFTRLFGPKVAPGGKIYAVDIAKKYVDYIQQTCRDQKIPNVVGVVCTADSTSLAACSIDLVFICDTYHHFNHPEKNLASIHEALKPCGRLIIVEFKKDKSVNPEWVLKHVRPDRDTLVKEVTQAGFKLLDEPDVMKTQLVLRFEKSPGK